MPRLLVPFAFAAGLIASTFATPAAAQFDVLHNNLKCYKITGGSLQVNLQLDNQFGRERVAQLVPQFLCAPTQKQCCTATPPVQCSASLCNAEPSPNQPAPVDHFKCYKIKVKECTPVTGTNDFDCSKLTGRFPPVPPAIAVTLLDQFHQEDVTVGHPKMLCVPVEKIRVTTTTTATSSTTTTTRMCAIQPGTNPPMCGGDCGPGLACRFSSPTSSICECIPACGGTVPNCAGGCAVQSDQCHATSGTSTCDCCRQIGLPCTAATVCCSGQPCNAAGNCP